MIKTLKGIGQSFMTCSVEKTIAALIGTSINNLSATRKYAQTVVDIIKEIDVEDVVTANTHEQRNDFQGCEADVSLNEIAL
ncbi:hypothetical protein F383_35527 [Gossypium arboreum]|uniref:Uncharacterized protein n=1 Tax=Gossypium arboreum TaxID=29729 RepID=A0A0B0NC76_GOSAR|nr:hypothetical protein F383_35527 [Gossypium arboreum]